MKTHYRQGDVMIRRVKSIPAAAADVTPNDRIVLAHGEVTGHAHAITDRTTRELSFADVEQQVRRFLKVVGDGATVRHEEHAPIALPPGFYEIVQQREYTPEAIRNVAD